MPIAQAPRIGGRSRYDVNICECGTTRSEPDFGGEAFVGLFAFDARHVDNVPKVDLPLVDAVDGFVDVVNADELDARDDVVFATEVEHLLRLRDATNERALNIAPVGEHFGHIERRLQRHQAADDEVRAVASNQRQILVRVVRLRNGAQNQIELRRERFHLLLLRRDDEIARAELECSFALVG